MATRSVFRRLRSAKIEGLAALLVTLASLCAALAWISAGKAGGRADDLKTAALGFVILRLEAATEASNALVQAQSYLTQAGMYYAEADAATDATLAAYLSGLGDQSLDMSTFQSDLAAAAQARSATDYAKYEEALAKSARHGAVSDRRSTAALILNVSTAIASAAVLLKRRVLLAAFAPVFLFGIYWLASSLF
ncbi:MAG: hypothetical protein AB1778_07360 [Candidatus Bipolaricaulota bacterium]